MKTCSMLLAALLLAPAARADKFHLGSEAEAKRVAEGANPTTIEGVLLAETPTHYHVRVVGGEIVLEKKNVWKVEKDALTVADIVASEKDLADKSAAEAAARPPRGVVVEATAGGDAAPEVRPAPAAVPAEGAAPVGFDPVIGRVVDGDGMLLQDVEAAWQLTKDRRYLKLLRKMRRMR